MTGKTPRTWRLTGNGTAVLTAEDVVWWRAGTPAGGGGGGRMLMWDPDGGPYVTKGTRFDCEGNCYSVEEILTPRHELPSQGTCKIECWVAPA